VKVFLLVIMLAAPCGAFAQDLSFDMSATDSCLDAAGDQQSGRSCIGASANACMEATQGGSSTVGMGACLAAERDEWDARLNEVYQARMAEHRASDAEYKPALSEADTLRDAQRAWIPFRDANCLYEISHWGGGTGAGPAGTACAMRMTAERALELGWTTEDYR
jgi:uncharacterized protein YecT (DUF1311 family)